MSTIQGIQVQIIELAVSVELKFRSITKRGAKGKPDASTKDASLLCLTREDLLTYVLQTCLQRLLMSYFVLHVSYRTKRYTLKMLIPTVRVVL